MSSPGITLHQQARLVARRIAAQSPMWDDENGRMVSPESALWSAVLEQSLVDLADCPIGVRTQARLDHARARNASGKGDAAARARLVPLRRMMDRAAVAESAESFFDGPGLEWVAEILDVSAEWIRESVARWREMSNV